MCVAIGSCPSEMQDPRRRSGSTSGGEEAQQQRPQTPPVCRCNHLGFANASFGFTTKGRRRHSFFRLPLPPQPEYSTNPPRFASDVYLSVSLFSLRLDRCVRSVLACGPETNLLYQQHKTSKLTFHRSRSQREEFDTKKQYIALQKSLLRPACSASTGYCRCCRRRRCPHRRRCCCCPGHRGRSSRALPKRKAPRG